MSMEFGDLTAQITGDRLVAAAEIAELRRLGWADGRMTPDEAEALFVANEISDSPDPEWCDFFVEALTSFVVNTVEPRGYVDAEMAQELIARVDREGRVGTMAELELLVRVIETASSVPGSLRAYALHQVEEAVAMRDGPTRQGEVDRCGINAVEVNLIRRVIFASASEHSAGIGKADAELLFRIKDMTLYEANCPDWTDLFVKGVAQYLLRFASEEVPDNDRMRELKDFMNREGAGIGGFLARIAQSDQHEGFGSLLGGHEPGAATLFTVSEQTWLQDMLDADEDLDDLERALIAFIDAETGQTFVPRPSPAR